MKPVIVREIRRPKAAVVRTLGELGVATVHEAGPHGLMRPPAASLASARGRGLPSVPSSKRQPMIHAAPEVCRATCLVR
jgi:4-hydroxy-4-methyl-2-oxoglutarate aldolase